MLKRHASSRSFIINMRDAIKNFAFQFAFKPQIKNAGKLFFGGKKYSRFIVAGMGGSHLAADLIKTWNPAISLYIHSDYGLPHISKEDFSRTLFIASSYSGNTEETLDAFNCAAKLGLARAVISVGGELLALAQKEGIPYVQLPDTGIQPRSALGLGFKALLKLMGQNTALKKVSVLAKSLQTSVIESQGKELARKISGSVPVIYAAHRNAAIAYNWKIKLNETGKIPAFYNLLPELNHNEMTGFDVQPATAKLSDKFSFIFLEDESDHVRTLKRMRILAGLYRARKLSVIEINLTGDIFHKVFSTLILGDWTAYHTALRYGVEAEQVPMVEEFKKLI